MAAPRVPYGQKQPGQLAATMLKVLAAEMSDSARLSRGQRYFADRAVVDIEVKSGLVVCEVQGARPDPYHVRLQVTGGEGVPMRSELRVDCECPDADVSMVRACKHAVAAIFALANEVLIDPEVLVQWRADAPRPTPRPQAAASLHSPAATSLSSSMSASMSAADPGEDPAENRASLRRSLIEDRFGGLLEWPTGTGPISIPRLDPWVQPAHSNPQLEEILASARSALELDWG
jgi:hypothetical protein